MTGPPVSPRLNHPTTSNPSHLQSHTRSYLDSIFTIRSSTPIQSSSTSASSSNPTPPALTRSPSFLSASGSVSAYRPQKPSTLSSAEGPEDDDEDEEEEDNANGNNEDQDEEEDDRRALGSLVSKLNQYDLDEEDSNPMDSSSSSTSNSSLSFLNGPTAFTPAPSSDSPNPEPSLMSRVGSTNGQKDRSTSTKELQNEILSALDRDEDDEERIEIVREKLSRALMEVEGFEVVS